jgi:hypothetical protein
MMTRTIRPVLAVAVALCVGGCGGGGAERSNPPPQLPRALAVRLAAESDAVADALAAGDSCRASALAAQLQREAIAGINGGRVPAALQEPLSGSVNELVARVQCIPPPEEQGKGKHKGHAKHGEGD